MNYPQYETTGVGWPDGEQGARTGTLPVGVEVITLCGSMRNFSRMLDAAARLTVDGAVVLAPFMVMPTDAQSSETKIKLDELHLRKIDMSSRVVVVSDMSGYFGDSTRAEVAYAQGQGKPVDFWRLP